MKSILFTLCFFSCMLSYAQEIFQNKSTGKEALFLGAYNEDQLLKVYESGQVQYLPSDQLEQIDQLKPIDFLELLSQKKLKFYFEGHEPLWNLTLKDKQLSFYGNETLQASLNYTQDTQSGFNFMFSSKDLGIYGVVLRRDHTLEKTQACNLSTTDDYTVFEIYFTLQGKMYKGCGYISP